MTIEETTGRTTWEKWSLVSSAEEEEQRMGRTSLSGALAATTNELTVFCTAWAPTFSLAHSGWKVLLAKRSFTSSSAAQKRSLSDLGEARTDWTAMRATLPVERRTGVEEVYVAWRS